MKALVFHALGRMGIEAVPAPELERGDMLIRIKAAAICGTDMRILKGTKTRGVRMPSIPGHEFSGVIEDAGRHAQWQKGQRVAVCPALPCGHCNACRSDAANICEQLTAYGYELDGGFAEYLRVPASFVEAGHVIAIPDHVSFEEAALAEPLACVINGQSLMGPLQGQSIAVLGAGPIGLLHVMLARAQGSGRISVVQRSGMRRKAALELGADAAVPPEDAHGISADAAIVAVGSDELANMATHIVRPRGVISLFAGFPVGEMPQFDLNAVHYKEQRVTGAFGLDLAQFREALALIASGTVAVGRLVTHRFMLDHAMDAFDTAGRGEALKVVIAP